MSVDEDLSFKEESEKDEKFCIPSSNLSILDIQTHAQRERLFKCCLWVIGILYLLAFVVIVFIFLTGSFISWAIIEHPHIMAIPLSLLISRHFSYGELSEECTG